MGEKFKQFMISRIKNAWQKCKVWVVEDDSALTETFFQDIPKAALSKGLSLLSKESNGFRIKASCFHESVTMDFSEKLDLESLISCFISG